MKYRPEIDGLRAIAVLAVLIFHINPAYLPGGFIGVDIFFVISGFLIMGIIRKQVQEDTFSYSEFYARRIKRLLPLFFSVVIFCLIVGYFLLLPDTFRLLARDLVASNVFLANVISAISGNYFESDNLRPTLHFWSLAVEEQFYFLMPTLFILLYRYLRKYTVAIFVLLLIASLFLSEILSSDPRYSAFSYFLLPTRAWELLAGCLLALVKPTFISKHSTMSSIIGIILILIGLITINEDSVFPGLIAIPPILGSVLLIGSRPNIVSRLLSTKPFLIIGKASYSIYMWHWPIIIFLKVAYGKEPLNWLISIILSIIIIFIGILSQKYIEDYFRFKKGFTFKKSFAYFYLLPFFITTGYSLFVYKNSGLPERYDLDARFTVTATTNCSSLNPGCFITENKNEDNKVLMIGDSHADHFANLFTKWFDKYDLSLKLYATGGCNFYSTEFNSNPCESVKKDIAREITTTKTIIIAKRLDNFYNDSKFLKEFSEFLNSLTSKGKNVILIKQVPKFKSSGFLEEWMIARRYDLSYDYDNYDIDKEFLSANDVVFKMFEDNENIKVLDFNNVLLSEKGEYMKFDQKHLPLYYNSNHLTAYGAEYIFNEIVDDKKYNWVIDLATIREMP